MKKTNLICQKGFNWKIKIILLLTFLFITFLFTFIYFVDLFFDNYDLKFQSPIILRTPIILEKRETPKNIKNLTKNSPKQGGKSNLPIEILAKNSSNTPKPKTEKEIIFSYKNGDILWKIYGLESSWGRNDGCREQGKYNGFGYGQNKYVWNCFNSFEEVVEKVNNWFEKRLKENGNDLAEALCYYNLGLPKQVNCKYYQSFISL